MKFILTLLVGTSPILLLIGVIYWDSLKARKRHRENRIAEETWYRNVASIRPGMHMDDVFGLIGNPSTHSFLQDGTELCEWIIKQPGSMTVNHTNFQNGASSFSVTSQTTGNEFTFSVKFKDDVVIEAITNDRMV